MDTCICDISALKFWRTPPVVRLLVAGQEDSDALARHVSQEELLAFRTGLYTSLPFCAAFANGPAWRRHCGQTDILRNQFMALAPSLDLPVDLLARDKAERRTSSLLKPRLWSGELPAGSIIELTDELCAASPSFALQQVAAHAPWLRTYMIASELCGSFAVYSPPAPIRTFMQKLLSERRLPSCGGWEPFVADGRLTNLWKRAPLLSVDDIVAFAESCESTRGKAKILSVAKLLKPNAASPLEVQTGMLLGLPRRLGGEGHSDFEFNAKVDLSREARGLAQRSCCYCDLYWEKDGLDIECQSMMAHNSWGSFVSDFDRATALGQMGIKVMLATSESIFQRREAFLDAVAASLGKTRKPLTEAQSKAEAALSRELMLDWNRLLQI